MSEDKKHDTLTAIHLKKNVALSYCIVTLCCLRYKQCDPVGCVVLHTFYSQSATVSK